MTLSNEVTLSIEHIQEYYTLSRDPDAEAALLAKALELPEYRFDAWSAIKVDYASSLLELAKDLSFGPLRTSSLFTIGQAILRACIGDKLPLQGAEDLLKQRLIKLVRPVVGPDGANFAPEHVAKIGQWFTATLFRHYNLYSYVFSNDQAHTEYTTNVLVETALIQSFEDAMSEEEWEAHNRAIKEAAEVAEREAAAAAEAAAKEAAEREAAAAAAEEAARRAAELARKPATLEEAIETMVAIRLEQEKILLEQEYKTKQEGLLTKISELEGKVTVATDKAEKEGKKRE